MKFDKTPIIEEEKHILQKKKTFIKIQVIIETCGRKVIACDCYFTITE